MSILKIEGQIFSQNIFECPSVHSQNRRSDFFHRIFLSVLSVQVSILKLEGQISQNIFTSPEFHRLDFSLKNSGKAELLSTLLCLSRK